MDKLRFRLEDWKFKEPFCKCVVSINEVETDQRVSPQLLNPAVCSYGRVMPLKP